MKKPRKAYKPRNPKDVPLKTQPWRLRAVFEPLEAILRQLEQEGTSDHARDGVAIFRDRIDGNWYETKTALLGVAECFQIHAERQNISIDTKPLEKLANKLHYAMPIFAADTQAAWICLDVLRAHCLRMTCGYAADLIKTIRIREELDHFNLRGIEACNTSNS
jgi:hypothetical protein